MKIDGINEINQTVQDINNRFLDGKKLAYIGNPSVFEKAHGANFGWRSDINAAYAPTRDSILFKATGTDISKLAERHAKSNASVKVLQPVESLRNYLKSSGADPAVIKIAGNMEARMWSVNESPKGLIAHEMGHRIYYQHPDKLELHKLLKEEYDNKWPHVLSLYSTNNPNEFFAESFSAYVTEDTSRISPRILEWIQKNDGDLK